MNVVLWIIQILLTLLFLFAGGTKLLLSSETLQLMNSQSQVQLPILFLRFIGIAEIFGALGLILPGLLRIKTYLTPLAALGLLIITIGAVVVTVIGQGVGPAIVPFVAGLLCAFVAYGRTQLAPLKGGR